MYPRAPPSGDVGWWPSLHPPAGLKANKQKPVVEVATTGGDCWAAMSKKTALNAVPKLLRPKKKFKANEREPFHRWNIVKGDKVSAGLWA